MFLRDFSVFSVVPLLTLVKANYLGEARLRMYDDLQLGKISELGQRYLSGQLRQHQLAGSIQLSQQQDVQHVAQFSHEQQAKLIARGLAALSASEVAFSVLAAGASTRMDLQKLPAQVTHMLQRMGVTEVPTSKALVPVVELDEQTLSYLDLFLINVRRFSEQTSSSADIVLFVSEKNRLEINAHLTAVKNQGVADDRMILFEQPLAPQIVATEADLKKAEKNFASETWSEAWRSLDVSPRHGLPEKKPAGHGEFLHQLVESGTLAPAD